MKSTCGIILVLALGFGPLALAHDPNVRTFETHLFSLNFLKQNGPTFLKWVQSKDGCLENQKFPASTHLVQKILARLVKVSPMTELYEKLGVIENQDQMGIGCVQLSDETSVQMDSFTFERDELLDAASEDEVAFFLAHELGHYFLLHPVLKIQTEFLKKSFSHDSATDLSNEQKDEYKKNLEFQADALGLQILSDAGYSASSAATVVSKFGNFEKESKTHPSPARRYKQIQIEIQEHRYPALKNPTATEQFLKAKAEVKAAIARQATQP